MRDWQIRLVGASKLIFPASLAVYLIILYPHSNEHDYIIIPSLIMASTTISWIDLLAIEDPREWCLRRGKIYSVNNNKKDHLPDYLPNIKKRPLTYISISIFLFLVAAAFLEYYGSMNYISNSDNPPYKFATIADIIGGVGSVLFSIILVMLYDKQASISETQSIIQKEQAELMRREREPRLSGPYNFRFWGSSVPVQSKLNNSTTFDSSNEKRDPNPNSLQFFQTNAGEGLAQNFRLTILIDVNEGPHEGRGARCAVQRMDRFPLRKFGESDLQGGEKDVEFMTEELKLTFTEPNPDGDSLSSFDTYEFEDGINTLVEQGTTEISLIFTLTWEDEFGEKYTDQVYQKTSELRRNMDLLDFIR